MAKPDGAAPTPAADDSLAEMEQLKKTYLQLDRRKTACETNLKHAETRLAELKAQAREAWGTDDLAQLQAKLAEMKAENRRKCEEYRQSLEKIQADLQAVEQQYSQGAEG